MTTCKDAGPWRTKANMFEAAAAAKTTATLRGKNIINALLSNLYPACNFSSRLTELNFLIFRA